MISGKIRKKFSIRANAFDFPVKMVDTPCTRVTTTSKQQTTKGETMTTQQINGLMTVDRINDTLVLMDADGQVIAAHQISDRRGGRREAKRVLHCWLETNTFEIAAAMNLV